MSKFKTPYSFSSLPGALMLLMALLSFACNSAMAPRPASSSGPPVGANAAANAAVSTVQNEKEISAVFDVPLTRLDGTTFNLADFKGKVTVVDFWATWCPPCVKQVPQLAELSKRYRDRGLEVVGLTFDPRSDQGKVEEFMKRYGINYQVAYSSNWVSNAFLKGTEDDTGAPPIPQLFVISRQGRVVEHMVGGPERGIEYLERVVTRELSLNTAPQ